MATALNMLVLPALYWLYGHQIATSAGVTDELRPDYVVRPTPSNTPLAA